MGRAERRRLERENRLLYSREKSVKMSKDELRSIKRKCRMRHQKIQLIF